MEPWHKFILFAFIVILPSVIVGTSNLTVFPDSAWAATIMLVVTVGVAAIFTWQSGNATAKISQYCIIADVIICAILCVNLGGHWILSREVSAAKQGVEEKHTEEDREEKRKADEGERRLKLAEAEEKLANAQAKAAYQERRRLAQLPFEQRQSAIAAPKAEASPEAFPSPEPTATPKEKGKPEVKLTPEQVRNKWWYFLTALAIAECAASVLAGAVLGGIWEWDKNKNGIPDHLEKPKQQEVDWPRQVGK